MEFNLDLSTYSIINPVITIGAFDGVHLGHAEILRQLKQKATQISGESIVVTFWPHPRHVLQGNNSLKLLNTHEEKLLLLKNFGVEHVIVIPFTPDFSKISSYDFIRLYLFEQLNIRHFILGYNHHIGKDREGNIDIIRQYANEFGFSVSRVEPYTIDHEKISSTKIRHAIAEGTIDFANKLLGYHYMITGKVVEGQKLGRKIGFPTANIHVCEDYKLIPKDGVYAVRVNVGGMWYKGMLNIGYRPTVNSEINSKTLEVHILNFKEDIYNHQITIEFISRIRDEVKFLNLDMLKTQLEVDKRVTSEIVSLE